MWWQVVAALIGIALMAAPDALRLPEPTGTLVHVLAPIGAAFAIVAASAVTRGVRYVASLAAGLLAIGVVLLGTPMPGLLLVAGAALVMAILATRGGGTKGSFGGGWSALR